jgi:two-component system response regulator NreC
MPQCFATKKCELVRWTRHTRAPNVMFMVPALRLASAPVADLKAPSKEPIKIVLADDHATMRKSLRLLLEGESDIDVLAEVDSLQSVMEHIGKREPDVLVLDLGMSESGSGIETLSRLKQQMRSTNIVVLTMNDDLTFAKRVLQNGALGLVLKELSDSDLPSAVRLASRGQRYVSPPLAKKLGYANHLFGEDRLTPREREVLRLIALGHTSVEIAEKLGLSPRTIETHRARIYGKLQLSSRAELVSYALHHDLLRV